MPHSIPTCLRNHVFACTRNSSAAHSGISYQFDPRCVFHAGMLTNGCVVLSLSPRKRTAEDFHRNGLGLLAEGMGRLAGQWTARCALGGPLADGLDTVQKFSARTQASSSSSSSLFGPSDACRELSRSLSRRQAKVCVPPPWFRISTAS